MKNLLLIAALLLTLTSYSQNNAVSFDGVDDYVEITDNNAIDLSANFTIEAWIYPAGSGSQPTEGGMIFNKENSYELARFTNGTLQFALSANGVGNDWAWVNTGLIAPLNQWSHVAFVKSGSGVTVYLNDITPFTTGSQPASMTANAMNLRIGGRTNVSHNFNGSIDEFRIWNISRTQTEIKTQLFSNNLSMSTTGLVAAYRLNAGSGTTAVNSCTNTAGIDGTLVNSPAWVSSPVQFAANALSFDGSNDYVLIPDDNTLDITSAITLEAWVYATKNTGVQNVMCKSSSGSGAYIFPRTDNGWANAIVYLYIGGWKTLSAPYASLNAWHHLAATYDGAQMKLYIDGVLAASKPQTGTLAVSNNPLFLGNQGGGSEYFGGYADEFRVWNVARTQTEIQNNMTIELNPATQTGLVSYYTGNQGVASGTNSGLITLPDQKGSNNGTLTNFSLTGATSNYITQSNGLFTLPLQWKSFTATGHDDKVILNWSTASEQNTRDFIVQHSRNAADWNDIITMPAATTSTGVRNYSYLHTTPATGINFYRIRQTDLDNRSSYSAIRVVKLSADPSLIFVIGNPVINGMLQVQVNDDARLSLYDVHGKLLFQKKVTSGMETINVTDYPKGIYILEANGQKTKIVIQ